MAYYIDITSIIRGTLSRYLTVYFDNKTEIK